MNGGWPSTSIYHQYPSITIILSYTHAAFGLAWPGGPSLKAQAGLPLCLSSKSCPSEVSVPIWSQRAGRVQSEAIPPGAGWWWVILPPRTGNRMRLSASISIFLDGSSCKAVSRSQRRKMLVPSCRKVRRKQHLGKNSSSLRSVCRQGSSGYMVILQQLRWYMFILNLLSW